MSVFKAYKKVILKNLPSLMIYFGVFLATSLIFINSGGAQTSNVFTASKMKVAILSEDRSALVAGLTDYLSENAQLVQVREDEQSIQDALFFGKADYILTVPAGFTESFMSGKDIVSLKKMAGADTGSVSADLLVNKYLNLAALYVKDIQGISQDDIVQNVIRDLGSRADIQMTATSDQQKTAGLADYFRLQAYPIIAIMLMGITAIMLAFNDPEVSRRNLCSPVKPSTMSRYLFLGNMVLAVIVWALLCVIALALHRNFEWTPAVGLLCLNALALTMVSLSMGFLAGKFIKGGIAQAALTNVVSLGMSFLCGIFVDQVFLGQTVQKIASFLPAYWYAKAVESIKDLQSFSFDAVQPILGDMLIQLGFAAACVVIALVATKQKKQTLESYVW